MSQENTWGEPQAPVTPEIHVFPGADNVFELYEDDGETNAYLAGEYAITHIQQTWKPDELTLTINPVEGKPRYIPEGRHFALKFKGITNPSQVSVLCNGTAVSAETTYDTETETLCLAPL